MSSRLLGYPLGCLPVRLGISAHLYHHFLGALRARAAISGYVQADGKRYVRRGFSRESAGVIPHARAKLPDLSNLARGLKDEIIPRVGGANVNAFYGLDTRFFTAGREAR